MGREIKRVEAGFDWPLGKVWDGFICPLPKPRQCPVCAGTGSSPIGQFYSDQWYGKVHFDPRSTGSKRFEPSDERIAELVRRKISYGDSLEFYLDFGRQRDQPRTEEEAVRREASRMCGIYNSSWSHHLSQCDVDALLKADRLWDFTRVPRTASQRAECKAKVAAGGNSWLESSNGYTPTAEEVNWWSLYGLGHDSINQMYCVRDRCKREGLSSLCDVCKGSATHPEDEEIAKKYEDWEGTEPPAGDWWQIWETVSEGSPVTPAFATPYELIEYLVENGDLWDQQRGKRGWKRENAEKFVGVGWAPSGISIIDEKGEFKYVGPRGD